MATAKAAYLRKGDFRSDTWKRVRQEIEHDLASARERLESFENSEVTTGQLRGKIAALKNLLAREKAPAAEPRQSPGTRVGDEEPDDEGQPVAGF